MKSGTLVDLYEKLPNTKFEANQTSMSQVMLEAKIGKDEKRLGWMMALGGGLWFEV